MGDEAALPEEDEEEADQLADVAEADEPVRRGGAVLEVELGVPNAEAALVTYGTMSVVLLYWKAVVL